YDDPKGRFHFRHPQELALDAIQLDELDLIYPRPDRGSDVLRIILVPEQKDSQRDRLARDPEALRRQLRSEWEQKRYDLVPGEARWLPAREGNPPTKVYRLEAAIKPVRAGAAGRDPVRVYLDHYLVLFPRNQCIYVQAMTDRDDHVPFRDQAEALIESFEFGPSPDQVPAAPANSAAPPPPR